jgi:hypothetical protein
MSELITLLHSVHKSRLAEVLKTGLKATSHFDDLGLEMRRGVVYCWLRKEDDKKSGGGQRADHTYVEVTVHTQRCRVADMEWSSLTLMYLQGQGGKPRNPEASQLLAKLYEVTAVPLTEYRPGMFWTPEILVKGDIGPENVRMMGG